MQDRNRNVIIELGNGEKLGVRIDHWAMRCAQLKTKCKGFIDLFSRIGFEGEYDLEVVIVFTMEIVNEYNHYNKIDIKIDERAASEYIDNVGGWLPFLEKIREGLNQYIPKNLQPPQTKRGKVKSSQAKTLNTSPIES